MNRFLFPVLFLILTFLGSAQIFAQSDLPLGEVRVVRVFGDDAVVIRGNTSSPITRGISFTEGDFISTNSSRVMVVFSTGATTIIYPDTTLSFETLRQAPIPSDVTGRFGQLQGNPSLSHTRIRLEEGELLSEVKMLRAVASESTFEVATRVGVAGVRGTLTHNEYRDGVHSNTIVEGEGYYQNTNNPDKSVDSVNSNEKVVTNEEDDGETETRVLKPTENEINRFKSDKSDLDGAINEDNESGDDDSDSSDDSDDDDEDDDSEEEDESEVIEINPDNEKPSPT